MVVERLNSQLMNLAFFLQGRGRGDEAESFGVWVGITCMQYPVSAASARGVLYSRMEALPLYSNFP